MLLPVSHAGSVVDYPQSGFDASTSEVFIYLYFFLSLLYFTQFFPFQILGDSSSGFSPKCPYMLNVSILWVISNGMMLPQTLTHVKIFGFYQLSSTLCLFLSVRHSSLLVTLMCFPSRPGADRQGLITLVSAVPNGHRSLGAPCRAVFLSVSSGTPGLTCPLVITNDLQRVTY